MEKINLTLSRIYTEIDRTLKPLDIIWHIFVRYTGMILIVVGVITTKWEVATVGALLFILFILNQMNGALLQIMNEVHKLHAQEKLND